MVAKPTICNRVNKQHSLERSTEEQIKKKTNFKKKITFNFYSTKLIPQGCCCLEIQGTEKSPTILLFLIRTEIEILQSKLTTNY